MPPVPDEKPRIFITLRHPAIGRRGRRIYAAGHTARRAAVRCFPRFILIIFLFWPCGPAFVQSPPRFGILYEPWHCLVKGRPIHDIAEFLAGRQALGPAPEFHWWSKPAAGYYCLTENDPLLREHARQLADAGIDFVAVDFSNHDSLSYQYVDLEYLEPLQHLLRVWSTIPDAPKVVPFVQVTRQGDLYREIIRRLRQYPNLMFEFRGKPLLLIVANAAVAVDAAKRAALEEGFTTRTMWDDGSNAEWYFISRCQRAFLASKATIACNQPVGRKAGRVEEVPVAAAFQHDYMSDPATAVPRFGGATFLKQMARVDDFKDAPIVFILGWNQWIVQRLCAKSDLSPDPTCTQGGSPLINGNPVFTDEFSEEYSNDMEPGGAEGDKYYRLLLCEITRRKNAPSAASCP